MLRTLVQASRQHRHLRVGLSSAQVPSRVRNPERAAKVKWFQNTTVTRPASYCMVHRGSNTLVLVDGGPLETANWMRFVEPSGKEEHPNLRALIRDAAVYYRTRRPIAAGEGLLVRMVWFLQEKPDEPKVYISLAIKNDGLRDHGIQELGIAAFVEPQDQPVNGAPEIRVAAAPAGPLFSVEEGDADQYASNPAAYPGINIQDAGGHHFSLEAGDALENFGAPEGEPVSDIQDPAVTRGTPEDDASKDDAPTTTEDDAPKTKRQGRFMCSSCPFEAARRWKLELHQQVHADQAGWTCLQCGQAFRRRATLRAHEAVHASAGRPELWESSAEREDDDGGETPKHRCDVCGKLFAHTKGLQRHAKAHSAGEAHSCGTCGRTFSRKDHAVRHEREAHGGSSYSCSVCGKSFTRADHAKRHERVGHGAETHPCEICGKSFTRVEHVKRHRRAAHSDP